MQEIDFSNYDYNKKYNCDKYISCCHFNKLMYMITSQLNGGPIVSLDCLSIHIANNPNEINEINEAGWSPLLLASQCSNASSNRIVHLLLERGTDIDARDNDG